MILFWKATAIVILSVILGAAIGRTEKDIAVVLTTVSCCGIACLAIEPLSEVIAFILNFRIISEYQSPFAGVILKIIGVAVITEITALISVDAGCSSLEKAMQFLGSATILSLSLPLFESFLDIIQEILNVV